MNSIYRLFVEKRPGFNTEAVNTFHELSNFLQIKTLKDIRIFNRYDLQGVGHELFNQVRDTIFSDPVQDVVFEEQIPEVPNSTCLGVEFLPGQFDQRSDSAAQCIQIISRSAAPIVRTAKIYMLIGVISATDLSKIQSYLVNPVDSRIADNQKPTTLRQDIPVPGKIKRLSSFRMLNQDGLESLVTSLGLAMSVNDLSFCQEYFIKKAQRDPSITEIKVLDTYWSDHCRHTTFNTSLKKITFAGGDGIKPIKAAYRRYLDNRKFVYGLGSSRTDCLMDIATLAMKVLRKKGSLKELDVSDEINACSIKVDVSTPNGSEKWLVMFKNETHNHPTEIEPFGGAATCLGGAIRDPLSGRAYVYQAMRLTGSGDPRKPVDQTLAGKLPQRTITTQAARGYSSYGNQIGVATGLVSEIYHQGYVAKRLEIGAVVGAVKADRVVRKTPQMGDKVILLGGRTGKDGIGGATGSSKAHTSQALANSAEVQKGNAPTERKIQRLFTDPEVTQMIIRANDFGAGGVAVAVGELCDGLDIYLDAVPKKYGGLDGTEIAISESQERMAVVIDSGDLDRFQKKASEENIESVAIADVTDSKRLRMYWQDDCIVDIDRAFLNTNGIRPVQDVEINPPEINDYFKVPVMSLGDGPLESQWEILLADINVASQMGLQQQFDSSIGARTVLQPFGGTHGESPIESMVARLPFVDTTLATVMSWGFDPFLGERSAYHAGLFAVIQSVTKLVASGVDYKTIYMSFQEYFEKLGHDPTRWGKPYAALLGALDAQLSLGIAAIGGKDSMSGTFQDISVPPTLVSFAIATIDAELVISPEFKAAGHMVVCVYSKLNEENLIDFENLKEMYRAVQQLIKQKRIFAARSVGRYGLADALAKMSFGNRIGLDLYTEDRLFLPDYTALVLELDLAGFEQLKEAKVRHKEIGRTIAEPIFKFAGREILTIAAMSEIWKRPLEDVFPSVHDNPDNCVLPIVDFPSRFSINRQEKPLVTIPVFPGTNCEFDLERAFQKAGASCRTTVFRNQSPEMIDVSLQKWAAEIDKANIIMLPGGFSAGDEPDGSGKFIAAILRNPLISDAIMRLLNKRDGLVLGICNGFQALIKVGLIPFGKILKSLPVDAPTLTFNRLNRHYARPVHTKIISRLSPWFLQAKINSVHVLPISNGEGRVEASDTVLKHLSQQGQIATQYVDTQNTPSMCWEYNPSGSKYAIESMTSADGRILGKMAHSERIGRFVDKNIPGEKDQKVFASGVSYFTGEL